MFLCPKPRIPLYPVLGFQTPVPDSLIMARSSSVFSGDEVELTANGRTSLARGLTRLKLTPPFSVLAPAFHCIPMIEPIFWAGGKVIFYRLNKDLSVDLDDCKQKIQPDTKALLAAHYFGFPQNTAELKNFCNTNGLFFIEDCAHAFFGSDTNTVALGATGDVAIASPWKFFPIQDGGCLIVRDGKIAPPLKSRGVRFEAKSFANALEIAHQYGRFPAASKPLDLLFAIKNFGLNSVSPPVTDSSVAPNEIGQLNPLQIDKRMSFFSRYTLRTSDARQIVNARRLNYAHLLGLLQNAPGIQPLFPAFPETAVPYVLPMVMEQPARVFTPLKQRGIPILRFGEFRWPTLAPEICDTSTELSRCVFQFPCHQSLKADEIEWMGREITATLNAT
ncbi:MAG TPA: DegT/DnrJ/EryC1/StrS family aminotransferase [Burkholderiales bacterium]|nr:DegT/DnrJ/EryC1/StrS family aminotransferase [Burkholderiales bacterium]